MDLLHQVNDVHAQGRPDLFEEGRSKYSEEELKLILGDPSLPVFVSVDAAGTVEGYCFCAVCDHTADRHLAPFKNLYIDDLCVDAGLRGRGVGRKLYTYAEDYARRTDCHNITLNVWECNPGARDFYRHLGLVPQKTTLEKIL